MELSDSIYSLSPQLSAQPSIEKETHQYNNSWKKDYENISKIGSGGYATVYSAIKPTPDGKIARALKKTRSIRAQKLPAFYQEVNILKSCQHPNIISLTDHWLQEKNPILPQENVNNYLSDKELAPSSSSSLKKRKLSDSIPQKKKNCPLYIQASMKDLEQEVHQYQEERSQSNSPYSQESQKQANNNNKNKPQQRFYGFLETELCDETLADYIRVRNTEYYSLKQKSELSDAKQEEFLVESLHIAQQILSALDYLHNEKQIGHLDLKPQNIFLNKNKNQENGPKIVKLGDFGNAKSNENFVQICREFQKNNKISCLSYTQMYAPPEFLHLNQKHCQNALKQSEPVNAFNYDLYSLGVVLLQLFHPIKTDMEMIHLLKDYTHSAKINNNNENMIVFPQAVSDLIKLLLSQNSEKRPSLQTVQQTIVNQQAEYLPDENLIQLQKSTCSSEITNANADELLQSLQISPKIKNTIYKSQNNCNNSFILSIYTNNTETQQQNQNQAKKTPKMSSQTYIDEIDDDNDNDEDLNYVKLTLQPFNRTNSNSTCCSSTISSDIHQNNLNFIKDNNNSLIINSQGLIRKLSDSNGSFISISNNNSTSLLQSVFSDQFQSNQSNIF